MLIDIISRGLVFLRMLAWVFPVLLALELLLPREAHSWRGRLQAACFWLLYVLISAVGLAALDVPLRWLNLKPLFALAPAAGELRTVYAVAGSLASIVLADFFYYWFHRAQHRWFWPLHAVHHSIRELNGVNSFHHWTEELMRIPFTVIPMALLVPAGMERLPLIGALFVLQTYYLHCPTRLHFGWLRSIVVDNRSHRIHHSIEPRHYDKNFAATFALWDRLFGTAYLPAPDEWPATGVVDIPEATTIFGFLFGPFRRPREPALERAIQAYD